MKMICIGTGPGPKNVLAEFEDGHKEVITYGRWKQLNKSFQREKRKEVNKMAESLQLTIKEVDGPNPSGWYEVLFEDGTKASTKSEELAKAAFQSRESLADVTISKVTKGKFTNVYLNEVNGVKDRPKSRTSSTTSGSAAAPKDSERIARQWSIGRATELLIASDRNFDFPLSEKDMNDLKAQAEALITASK